MKKIPLVIIWILLSATTVSAAGMYVGDVINISMRTGPGFNQDVIQMIESGQELDVIEKAKEWYLVRLPDGKEGWVLGRYISSEKPNSLLLKILENEHQKLLAKDNLLQQQMDKIKVENSQLFLDIDNYKKQLNEIKRSYDALKEGSADFFELQTKYETSLAEVREQAQKIHLLGEQLRQRNINLFLIGAGILLFGFIVGFGTNKSRRRSSLLS